MEALEHVGRLLLDGSLVDTHHAHSWRTTMTYDIVLEGARGGAFSRDTSIQDESRWSGRSRAGSWTKLGRLSLRFSLRGVALDHHLNGIILS